ncbi:MAG: ice-binding family protein [Ignavibacteriota bacterium]
MKYFTSLAKQTSYALACLTVLFLSSISVGQQLQSPQAGPLRPDLGTAATYAIFTGGGAINNTGASHLTGDVGQDGAYAFNGFPPGTYTGTLNRNNSAAALAKSDLLTAWNNEASVACGFVLGVGIVNGQSFDPAVYCAGGASTTTGSITFDAHGDASAIFVVKIGGQLDANSGTHILLANNAQATNIYWFVDGAVNVADNSTFKGVIVARGAITFMGTSSLDGRALTTAGAINISANSMGPVTQGQADSLIVTHPAKGDSLTGGTQNYQITWIGAGITSRKIFEYSLDSGLTWKMIDTITADVFTHSWNVPDTASKKALVRITDANNLRGISGLFTIGSTKSPGGLIVIKPALGEMIAGGKQNYQIIWSGIGIASQKTFEYSLDSGMTWKLIGTINADVLTFNWNVPDTASKKALVRITDQNNLRGVSGLFTITSSKAPFMVIVRPTPGEMIAGGTLNYQITWTGTGITPMKTFEYSLDGGLTWNLIGSTITDVFSYNWNVPDTASVLAMIRITDQNGLTAKSGIFTILSSKSPFIIIVRPAPGEVIVGGTKFYQITWTGTGLATQKTFELSLDGGLTWSTFGSYATDAFTYNWNVPDTSSLLAVIRITDGNGNTGKSGIFTIQSNGPGNGGIIITHPVVGEVIDGGTNNFQIVWTGAGLAQQKTIELSTNGGSTWTIIGTVFSDAFNYFWNVPNISTTSAFIRITDANGVTGTSGRFTILSTAGVTSASSKDGYSISNYPNPAASQTTIRLTLPEAGDITLIVTNALGIEVSTIREHFDAGSFNIPFNTATLVSGAYSYTLQAGETRLVGKINIVR